MKKGLTFLETISITSMLFGLFFGAGNLIFPAYMGQLAGRNFWQAAAGFLLTGVGLPLLGVAALGISRSNGLLELSQRIGKRYGILFSSALYLTIGPFFAVPRCATVSFEIGILPMLSGEGKENVLLFLFSFVFFGISLWFSLRPGNILTWVGKILNPVFLLSLGVLMITALLIPMGNPMLVEPSAPYLDGALFSGMLEGYNTMDALAGLAFGIVVVNVIRSLGVNEPERVAACTVKAGIFSCALMGVIYIVITLVGAQSRGIYPVSANGGQALSLIAAHYFGKPGALILAATVFFACLKTAVGLITSCSETFESLLNGRVSYRILVFAFCGCSFLVATLGLDTIVAFSLPVLMFLYPLSITLIFLSLLGRFFGNDRRVYRWVTGFTVLAAAVDCIYALPEGVKGFLGVTDSAAYVRGLLPFGELGLGWLVPALLGGLVGLAVRRVRKTQGQG